MLGAINPWYRDNRTRTSCLMQRSGDLASNPTATKLQSTYTTVKDVRYSKGPKMSNFTFDARSQQWLVQLSCSVSYSYSRA